jgi:hypothetical protein
MSVASIAQAAYLVAALLFILALAGLSRHETARFGNTFGIAGMAIALVATLVLAITGGLDGLQVGLLIAAVLIGAAVGLYRKHNCHVKGCWRIAKQPLEHDGATWMVCHKHHPAEQLTDATMQRLGEEHRRERARAQTSASDAT